MELAINGLLSIIIIFLIWLFILFLYLTIRKGLENSKRRKIDQLKEKNRELMFKYLYKGQKSKHLIPDSQLKYVAIEELLSDFANVAQGEELQKRMTEFAEKYFLERYKKQLYHRRWSIRMNVLYHIESFEMKQLTDELGNLYESNKKITTSEQVQMLKLLTKFDHPKLFEFITSSKQKHSDFVYRILFSTMSEQTLQYFVAKFHKLPLQLKGTIIDVIGIQNRFEYGNFLNEQLKQPNDELRIRTLKALANILFPMSLEEVKRFSNSQLFEERIMILKICGAVRRKEYIPIIIEKMSDAHFAVRKQAGYTISRFPNGKEIFETILNTSSDTFAKDMASQWLERGINHGTSK